MGTATAIGLIALGIVAITLIMSGVTKLTLHLMKRLLEARISALYSPGDIVMKDLAANNFGLGSWGGWQCRGNGALVLTRDCLHFFQFVGRGDVRVPLESITEVIFTKSHLGKATIYDLLKVRFAVNEKQDSIALYLTDPKAWKSKIEELKAEMVVDGRQ